jgi:hypothetical protein
MTREQLIKHWEVIEAFKNGGVVQAKINGNFVFIENPIFDLKSEYRIKEEPKYVPFDFSDAEKLIGSVVKLKDRNLVIQITGVKDEGVIRGQMHVSYDLLLEDYTFLDGSVCGKIQS